jgi:hypothetical protein
MQIKCLYPPTHPPVHSSIHSPAYPFIHPPTRQSIRPSIHPPIHPSIFCFQSLTYTFYRTPLTRGRPVARQNTKDTSRMVVQSYIRNTTRNVLKCNIVARSCNQCCELKTIRNIMSVCLCLSVSVCLSVCLLVS